MKEEKGRVVEVELMGRKIKVGSEQYNEEYIKKVADYVRNEIDTISSSLKSASTLDIAILAAMNIAEKYINQTDEQKAAVDVLLDKSDELISYIGERLN
jgi:cell division protein ZapA (FtsZ GTPase activity inhibitor)